MSSKHIVLAGDSIFDNDGYVIGEPGVIEQLGGALPKEHSASKVAVDGDCIRHVEEQLRGLPSNATDLVISVGGNDARVHSHLISKVSQASDLAGLLAGPLAGFRAEYRAMLGHARSYGLNLHTCTIYTAVPFEQPNWRRLVPIAIEAFNTVIAEEAGKVGVPIIRLEKVCTDDEDFSAVSPIEPSCIGGQKIVDHLIARLSNYWGNQSAPER